VREHEKFSTNKEYQRGADRIRNWDKLQNKILPGLAIEPEFSIIQSDCAFFITPSLNESSLKQHYFIFLVPTPTGWEYVRAGEVLIEPCLNTLWMKALQNIRTQAESLKMPDISPLGDHAILTFDQTNSETIPLHCAPMVRSVAQKILLSNYADVNGPVRYWMAWEKFGEKMIITQDPKTLHFRAKQHKINISNALLEVTFPALIDSNNQKWRTEFRDNYLIGERH
jgi:hypothetical protein